MFESRCGLKCSECEWREKMNCAGCTQISKPFWGKSCPIKQCVEKMRKVDHCGQCRSFPCKQLHEFAYDPATGNEGDRIETLTTWRDEEKPADAE